MNPLKKHLLQSTILLAFALLLTAGALLANSASAVESSYSSEQASDENSSTETTVSSKSLADTDGSSAKSITGKNGTTGEKNTKGKNSDQKTNTDGTDTDSESKDANKDSSTSSDPVEAWIESHTIEEKVAQLFVIRPELLDSTDATTSVGSTIRSNYEKYPVGGFILFDKNIVGLDQTKTLLADLRNLSETDADICPFLAVDEEGGRVVRVANKDFGYDNVGYMSQFGDSNDAAGAKAAGAYVGSYLKEVGFNTDLAPVFDVLSNPDAIVKDRVFSTDANVVANLAPAFSQGLRSAGVLSCAKHFPGHGNTASDTHTDFAEVTSTYDELKACDLIPYQNALHGEVSMIMVAHVNYPNVTGDYTPASLNKKIVTDILRKDMGYDGVIITDSLSMGAIANNYNASEVAIMAIEAGDDILLTDDNFTTMYDGLVAAVKSGRISEDRIDQSLRRILKLKQQIK